MTAPTVPREIRRIHQLVISATVAVLTAGLSVAPAHAGWQNHNETLLRAGR
jgi:hypothetical protein